MRIALVIVVLSAIAVGIVHVRRSETQARHELNGLQLEQVKLRRKLCDQQVVLEYLTAPRTVRKRADDMAVGLIEPKGDSGIAARQHPR